MVELKKLQKEVYDNKVNHGFNVTDLNMEFCLAYGELGADVAIYLLGMSEILGIDLESEILHKIEKNKKRIYKEVNGVHIKIEG